MNFLLVSIRYVLKCEGFVKGKIIPIILNNCSYIVCKKERK